MHRILAIAAATFLASAAFATQDVTRAAQGYVNGARAQSGLGALSASPELMRAARRHARDMARRGFFGHKGSNGSRLADRAEAAGYDYCFVAENIAKGHRSVDAVMRGWINSAGHRKNILSHRAREFAVVREGRIWVMVLGRPGC